MSDVTWPRPVAPSEEERRTLDAAIAHARRCGLIFQPGQVEIRWADVLTRGGQPCLGLTCSGAPAVHVYLKRGLPADTLFRMCLHELAHAWDEVCDRERRAHDWGLSGLSHDEGEARADRFVVFAMAPLEALTRGEVPTFPLPQWGRL